MNECATTSLQPSLAVSEYGMVPIAVETLPALKNLDFDLFIPAGSGIAPQLYRSRDYPVTCDDLDELLKRGVHILCMSSVDYHRYKTCIQDNLDRYLTNEQVPLVPRYQMLHGAARDLLAESYLQRNTDEAIDGASEVGQRLTKLLSGRKLLLSQLLIVMRHNLDTFGHVINVATYCLLLAERLGIHDQEELSRIASGALLHDIGKLNVPAGILNKPGPLTPVERDIVRWHPQTGFEELCISEDLNWGQLMMVYQHHERLHGKGYPVGVAKNEIHDWAQLCAVADVFEAVVSRRPYRRAQPVEEVLAHLTLPRGAGFNQDIVQCFTAILQTQP